MAALIELGALLSEVSEAIPFVVEFHALDLPNAGSIRPPFNPETFNERIEPVWEERRTPGSLAPLSDWQGNRAKRVPIKQMIQDQAGEAFRTEAFLRVLEEWATRPTEATQEPTLVLVSWGVHQHIGSITNLEINRLRYDERGEATLAEYSFDLITNAKVRPQ